MKLLRSKDSRPHEARGKKRASRTLDCFVMLKALTRPPVSPAAATLREKVQQHQHEQIAVFYTEVRILVEDTTPEGRT